MFLQFKTKNGLHHTLNLANVPLTTGFKQVCVWPGRTLNGASLTHVLFVETGARVQFLEEILTNPDLKSGRPVRGTGNRTDIFFAVHPDDVHSFATARLKFGIRWIEDVFFNDQGYLYPERVAEYMRINPPQLRFLKHQF